MNGCLEHFWENFGAAQAQPNHRQAH